MKEVLKEQQIQYIIDKAEGIFFTKGYAYTNISDISKAAKRSRTTIYSYFTSKENLYMAVIYKSLGGFIEALEAIETATKNGLEKVLLYSKGYLEFCKKHPQRYQMILDYYTYVRTSVIPAQEEENELIEYNYFEKVKKIALIPLKIMVDEIKKGQEDQSITSELPPETLFINIWAQLIGITHLARNMSGQNSFILLDVEVKDWQHNTLGIIQNLLTPC